LKRPASFTARIIHRGKYVKNKRRILSAVAAVTAGLVAAPLPGIPADAVTTPAAGVQIRLAHDNLCLNVQGASTADSAKIVQYTCTTDPAVTNDKFKLVPKGNAEYWIQAVGSGKCLNVQGNSLANGALIIQYTCGSDLNTLRKVNVPNGQANVAFRLGQLQPVPEPAERPDRQ
jgi:hypothetical protein